jgi:cytochrome c oxidase subunit 1/cytochrome c oxidase subunit I+III
MRERPVLDVAELPTVVFGSRAPLWWGVLGLMAIEGTMFAIMVASYFYLRGGAYLWPPPGVVHPGLGLTTLNLAILLGSLVPMHFATKAVDREDVEGIRNWLIVAVVFCVAFLAIRGIVLTSLTFRWDSHAYGSLVWTTVGLHTLHVVTGTLENLLFIILLIKGPVEDKHLLDLRLNSLYWYFVVFSWVPFYCIFFLDPGLLGTR